MEYRFLFPAEEEMTESAIFYEDRAEGLGSDYLNEVQRSINKICDNPKLGRKESERILCAVLGKVITDNEIHMESNVHNQKSNRTGYRLPIG